ncbi:hypothetical protein MLD38_020262 [Melastoma candidum]|uniref:Uncharacterized protein n=1 Tax=Melastoma candidum TaxID=119954 RepID=A0ACB9QCV6_9MYRT|nr:hypothetical protein MLD38_020262 [Melastoma candidum]
MSCVLLRMAYSGYCLYEPQFPPPCLLFREANDFSCSYDGSGVYFSSDVPPPYSAPGIGDLFASDVAMYSSAASLFGGNSWDWYDEHYDMEELPYEDYENWMRGNDSHFSSCWDDYFPKFEDGSLGNCHLNAGHGAGDFPQSESQIGDANVAGEIAPASLCYEDATSGYKYWLEQLWEEHSAQDQQEDPWTHSYDYELCSDIFGYFPCLSRRDPVRLWW